MNVSAQSPRRNAEGRIGWLAQTLTAMAAARSWNYSLTPNTTIIPRQGQPLILKTVTTPELLNSCRIACSGNGSKGTAAANIAATPVDTDLTLGTVQCFGVLVKLTNSALAFRPGIFDFELLDDTVSVCRVFVKPLRAPVEFVMLGVTDTGGQASVRAILKPVVRVYAASSSLTALDSFSAETLNERDLERLAQ